MNQRLKELAEQAAEYCKTQPREIAEALAVEGFTRGDYGWKSKSGYGYGRISRVLKEIK